MMRNPCTGAIFFIVSLVVVLGMTGVSHAWLVLDDDFSSPLINPDKWYGSEFIFGEANPDTEANRHIENGQLAIALTTWGRTDSDIGAGGIANLALNHSNPAAITTFQADVTVQHVRVVGCAANATGTGSRARLDGGFFNDGTSSGAGDRTGDIIAGIQLERDSVFGDFILAFIARCTNAPCTTSVTTAVQAFSTVWTQGVPITLQLQWDQGLKQFIYTVDPTGVDEIITLGYDFSDADPPVINFRNLSAANSAASCQSGPRTHAKMKALFGNVMVNP